MTRSRWIPPTAGVPGRWVEVEKGQPVLYFKPFETGQLRKDQAEAIGAHWDPVDGVTTITSERSLREHLARERAAGRDLRWREH